MVVYCLAMNGLYLGARQFDDMEAVALAREKLGIKVKRTIPAG